MGVTSISVCVFWGVSPLSCLLARMSQEQEQHFGSNKLSPFPARGLNRATGGGLTLLGRCLLWCQTTREAGVYLETLSWLTLREVWRGTHWLSRWCEQRQHIVSDRRLSKCAHHTPPRAKRSADADTAQTTDTTRRDYCERSKTGKEEPASDPTKPEDTVSKHTKLPE